jgi:hypothetical protein
VPSVANAQVNISDGTGGTSSDPTCSQENRIYTLDLANRRLVWDCGGTTTTANASSREIGWRCLSDSDYARARTALNQVVVTGEGQCWYDWNGPKTSLTLKSPTGYWIYGDEKTCGTAVDASRLSQFADILVALHNDAQPADGCVAGGSKGTGAGLGSPSTVNAILLFGGAGQDILGDTWKWDGQRWTELHPAHSPPARMSASMGTLGNRVVLFGGDDRITHVGDDYTYLLGDTWTWDGTDWTRECPAHSPAPRRYGLMKNTNGTLHLFGGTGLLATNRIDKPGDAISWDYQDVWTWNGKDWEEQFTPRLPTIYGAPAEALGSQVLLVDSTPDEGDLSADTWVWDGVVWSKRTPALAPPARGGASVSRLGDKVVLFGGYDWDRLTDGLRNDTWTWDGTSWAEQHPARSPSPRAGAMMATLGDRVILFGGSGPDTNLGDTWAWDGTNWTQVATSGPSPRSATVMIGQ